MAKPKLDPKGEEPLRVPIKAPAALVAELKAALHDGETVSGLTRQLWTAEIAHRRIEAKERKALEAKQKKRRERK